MSDDLISRKVLLDELSSLRIELNGISCRKEFKNTVNEVLGCVKHIVDDQPTAFDKEKVIEELKSWEKASHDAGIQSTYAELDNKASGYYQESRAYHRAIEIVEKGGIE